MDRSCDPAGKFAGARGSITLTRRSAIPPSWRLKPEIDRNRLLPWLLPDSDCALLIGCGSARREIDDFHKANAPVFDALSQRPLSREVLPQFPRNAGIARRPYKEHGTLVHQRVCR